MCFLEESILTSVKKLIGLGDDYTPFDTDICTHLNSVLMVLSEQLGVGTRDFIVTGPDETWGDFFGDKTPMPLVKTYVAAKVRIMFDPPTSGVLHEALERQIQEYEWRITVGNELREAGL